MMNTTDKLRQYITEQEYETYGIGDPVQIKTGMYELTIGYVSEIEDSLSGFQAYVVTDIKRHENKKRGRMV